MKLILGEMLCVFGLLYHYFILLGSVNPGRPWWASPILNDTIHLFVILICTAFGPTFIVIGATRIASLPELVLQLTVFSALLTGTVSAVKRMRVNQRFEELYAILKRQETQKIALLSPADAKGPGSGSHPSRKAA